MAQQAQSATTGTVASDAELARKLAPPAALVAVCNQAPLARYGRHLKGGAHTHGAWNGGWQIPLALAAWAGNEAADEKLLEQTELVLQGGNTVSATGGYSSQHERHVTGMFAILRQSPRFWNGKLADEQRRKIDLLMKATLVASAHTTSDATYADGQKPTALDGDSNLNRGWNPNYREGMFGGLLVGTVYFGGVEAATAILDGYDHDAFVAELRQAGLDNTHGTFAWAQANPESGAPTPARIEQAVRGYRFEGQPLMAPFALYRWLTLNTYSRPVGAGLDDGKGIVAQGVASGCIATGAAGLPNLGQAGMLAEFDSHDAKGRRSSITYAYDGFRPNLAHHVVLLVGGHWPADGSDADVLQRLDVGITDLAYKLRHGYRNYQHAKGSTEVFTLEKKDWDWSFRTSLPLWTDVLWPFHRARR